MNGSLEGGTVSVSGDAKQRFYDARGYGRPIGGNDVELTLVEAAHLLFRGDLDRIVDRRESSAAFGEPLEFEAFFRIAARIADRFTRRFLVYSDLRDRGFYLSPTRQGWPGAALIGDRSGADDGVGSGGDSGMGLPIDFAVYPRGSGPGDDELAYRIAVVDERERVPAAALGGSVLAVVDEESEISYFETTVPTVDGDTPYELSATIDGELVGDRVVCWEPPEGLHERGFYGQPLSARSATIEGAIQLSLIEAAALAADGRLSLAERDDPYSVLLDRGRAVEGDRFDRRLAVYRTLRDRSIVPKTGYKFGADFRTYDRVESVETLSHSERLIRVIPPDHVFDPTALSLDVRLAGGVRTRMVFASTDANGEIDWLEVGRLTP